MSAISSSPDLRVNTYVSGRQEQPDIAIGSLGSFVITWQSDTQDGDDFGIYGRVYNVSNAPISSEFQINTSTAGDQTNAAVAMAGNGDFIVTWASDQQLGGSGEDIYAQRFRSTGERIGSEFRINVSTLRDQTNPDVAIDALGNFVVVYESEGQNSNALGQDTSGTGIFGQRFDRTGALVGPEFRVNTRTDNDQTAPVVAMNSQGDFVTIWVSNGQDGSSTGVFGQRYNNAGVPIGIEFQVNSETRGSQTDPAIGLDDSGNFVVAWQGSDGEDGDGFGIYAQRYNFNGNPIGNEFLVNDTVQGDQTSPAVAIDASGGFTIVWAGEDNSSEAGIFGQRFDSNGDRDGSEFQVNEGSSDEQTDPVIALSPTADFVVAWQNQDGSGGDSNIRARTTVFKRQIRGTRGDDKIKGNNAGDRILGLRGDDTLKGLGGNDVLSGSLGSDRLEGGNGNDILLGGANDDILDGGNGSDQLTGNGGSDTFVLLSKRGNTLVTDFEDGVDFLGLSAGINQDDIRVEQRGESTLVSWRGIRLATLTGIQAQLITSEDFVKTSRSGQEDRGTNRADTLVGTGGNDEILGLGGDDAISGRGGDDELTGGNGNDRLNGEVGDDTLIGSNGNDRLDGSDGADNLEAGNGNDILIGGDGGDTFLLERKTGTTTIRDFQDNVDLLSLDSGIGPSSLSFQAQGADTVIRSNGQELAILKNILPSQISAAPSDFA